MARQQARPVEQGDWENKDALLCLPVRHSGQPWVGEPQLGGQLGQSGGQRAKLSDEAESGLQGLSHPLSPCVTGVTFL